MVAAKSISAVVEGGLCIGCGLCEAVTEGRVPMVATAGGSLRPASTTSFSADEERRLLAACPGTVAEARTEVAVAIDAVWGGHRTMQYAWAADPEVRHRAATGGALTALGMSLLAAGTVSSVLHVGADADQPMRSRWVLSRTPTEVADNAGSRYGPTAPLAGLLHALDAGEPFAVIAKPCDLGAIHRYRTVDPRVDELCVARLAMVCGGQSRLTKSTGVLAEWGIEEADLDLFRYRGHGNPGPLRVETADGRAFEKSYLDLWEDASSWDLESRCTVCPDALGEAADVAAADVWPGGAPAGEDEGFNGIVVRTATGSDLVATAVADGHLTLGDPITTAAFDDFQPHQVRKKVALEARAAAFEQAGRPTIETIGLRVAELGERLSADERDAQIEGTLRRIEAGRYDH